MKFFIQIILTILLTYILQLLLPWWIIFISAGIVGLVINGQGFSTFMAGFLGVGLLWLVQVYIIDQANGSLLSGKVAELFSLSSSLQLMLATALAGAICGGFGSLTGHFLGGLIRKGKRRGAVYY
jgi:hypothetical protein